MQLETKRLILREYTYSDFDELAKILTDPETMKYYPEPYSLKGVIKWIEWNLENYKAKGFGLWALILKENNKFIGDCGITMQKIDGMIVPEIGYHINKQYHNQGYASEAAQRCKDYLFENTTYDTVYSYLNYQNIPSEKVAIKNGMKFIKQYADSNDRFIKVYAITRSEWIEQKRCPK